jgi:hypothetical protein
MTAGIGGGGFPRIKEILAYLKSLGDTVITSGAGKAAQVNMRDALGNELGTAAGLPLKVDVSGDFPDNVQGAVEQANADVDPLTPGHRVKPLKTGGHANAAAPVAVAEDQIVDSWFDLNGREHVALDDGADATQGAAADAMAAAGGVGTISAKVRRLTSDVNGMGVLIASLEDLGGAGGAGIKEDIVAIAGTPPSTPGKIDTKTADGDDATLGAIADAAVVAGAAGSISAKIRRLSTDIDAMLTAVNDIDTVVGTPGAALPTKAAVIALDNAGNAVLAKADASGHMKVVVKTTSVVFAATGAGAISLTVNPAYDFYFQGITLHFSAAPTTAGNLTATLNPVEGAAYNTKLYTVDPSVGVVTDLVFQTETPLLCKNGDTIVIAYTNADGVTYGLRAIVTTA